jgi:hypothetical protein
VANSAIWSSDVIAPEVRSITNKPPFDFAVGYDHLREYTLESRPQQLPVSPLEKPPKTKPQELF